ncbi:MAG: glycoside hydrolase family 30 beta sandwich domain-containing protein, partial [Planctomycetota bacterium]
MKSKTNQLFPFAIIGFVFLVTACEADEPRSLRVFTTAKDTELRLTLSDQLQFVPTQQSPESDVAIFVNPDRQYQSILGFGGAITDASSEVYSALDADVKKELMRAYFDRDNGVGYSLLRTTIHSCDFASNSYTYVQEDDKNLDTFSIAPDKKFRIPMIRDALASAGGSVTTCASPWSAPAFMKNTNNMLQGGKLLPQYREAWANYFTKFIKAYEKEGIPIWGVTVQNEPMAKQTWESMIYNAEEERDFVRDYLGPIMEKAGLGEKKIIVWDHNRDLITHRANTILSDPEAAKYVWGVGFHWYETWAGGDPMFGNVAEVKQAFPEVQVLLTEACVEGFDPSRYQHWPNAERYGNALVGDLNAGAVGWLDWNILLNDQGGPNHVGNYCFAPVHVDSETGQLIFTPSYYYLGHFSKFIRPNARRVSAVSSRSSLMTTSFMNEDHQLATVVLNLGEKSMTYRYCVADEEALVEIPARAIQTLVFDTKASSGWQVDFFDDFNSFDSQNWQDQMIWVNDEKQCYVPDGKYGTREVSLGSLKLKVVNVGEKVPC